MTGALFTGARRASRLDADVAFFGIDPARIDMAEDGGEGLLPENVPAVSLFLEVAGQWRVVASPMGGVRYLGLDYGACEAGWRLRGATVTPDLWQSVQLIEQGARAALNEA